MNVLFGSRFDLDELFLLFSPLLFFFAMLGFHFGCQWIHRNAKRSRVTRFLEKCRKALAHEN